MKRKELNIIIGGICFFIMVLSIMIGLYVQVASTPAQSGCLVYGIDFNGKNEPFGLFCNNIAPAGG